MAGGGNRPRPWPALTPALPGALAHHVHGVAVSGELLTVASHNTRGIPLTGSQLAERYAVIGAGFDAGDADVVCCQEVFTYWHGVPAFRAAAPDSGRLPGVPSPGQAERRPGDPAGPSGAVRDQHPSGG